MINVLLVSDRQLKPVDEKLPDELKLAQLLSHISDRAVSHLIEQIAQGKGFSVDVTTLRLLEESLVTRSRLGVDYHIVIITSGAVLSVDDLLSAAEVVRGLNDSICFKSGVRVKYLPIVLNPWQSKEELSEFTKKTSSIPWLWVNQEGAQVEKTLLKALSSWCKELLLQLDHVGYGLDIDGKGDYRISPILTGRPQESELPMRMGDTW